MSAVIYTLKRLSGKLTNNPVCLHPKHGDVKITYRDSEQVGVSPRIDIHDII